MRDCEYIIFLRWSLHPSTNFPLDIKEINWHDLLEFAKRQGVVEFCWQGIQHLTDLSVSLSDDEIKEWNNEYASVIRKNEKAASIITEVAIELLNNDIDFFVLDGQPLSKNYSKTASQNSGINFYVFPKDRERAISWIKDNTRNVEEISEHSCEFWMDNVPCRLFSQTISFPNKGKQRYWDDLIDCYFGDILDHADINGVQIPVLPPTLNSIYLFVLIYNHFKRKNVSLRHLVDWMMFLEVKHNEVVVPELTAKLDKLGLLRDFKVFGEVLIKVLGMKAMNFPYAMENLDENILNNYIKNILR